MAITNFISTIWSETLYEALDKQYVAVKNCNRDFDGEIREAGCKVNICGVGSINVFDYNKNTDISSMQTLSDTMVELYIDRARAFNFQIDDIDRAQSSPKLMQAAMKVAASALANDADEYVYSLYSEVNANNTVKNAATNADNIIDSIIAAREKLYQGNVNGNEEIVLEVSPAVASLILKSKIGLSSSDEPLDTGFLGHIAGCKIYVSNNIKSGTASGVTYHKCFMRTKRAIAFADQLSEINAYRPESRFADAVKGLHLYGAKIVYPNELVLLDLGISA